MKLTFFPFSSELLSREILGLEECLPEELLSGTGGVWEEALGGNKPPAQGPGPGGMQQQMNGDDNGGNVVVVPPNVTMQRAMQQQHQQQLAQHLLQQVSGRGDSKSSLADY